MRNSRIPFECWIQKQKNIQTCQMSTNEYDNKCIYSIICKPTLTNVFILFRIIRWQYKDFVKISFCVHLLLQPNIKRGRSASTSRIQPQFEYIRFPVRDIQCETHEHVLSMCLTRPTSATPSTAPRWPSTCSGAIGASCARRPGSCTTTTTTRSMRVPLARRPSASAAVSCTRSGKPVSRARVGIGVAVGRCKSMDSPNSVTV